MAERSGLILLVPGLLHPPRGAEEAFDACPSLTRWLALSQPAPGAADWESALAELFGVPRPLSLAALRYAGERGAANVGWVAFADPVHLRVDPNRALLFGPQLLQLDRAEAEALVASLNTRLEEEHLRLELAATGQWYLCGAPSRPLQASPLGEVVGRNAEPFLPGGEGAAYWRRLLNELQMLLHTHPVNEARMAAGRPAVSSIWPWSAGALPERVETGLRAVISDDPGVAALARLANVTIRPPGEVADAGLRPGPVLEVDLSLQRAAESGDIGRWIQALQALEERWRDHERRARGLGRLQLWPASGHSYHGQPWRPWRRGRWPGLNIWRQVDSR